MGRGSEATGLGEGTSSGGGEGSGSSHAGLHVPVVAIGGHAGHGKSRLAAALAGIDVDRLQRRGGRDDDSKETFYATLNLSRQERVTLVDNPGASVAVNSFLSKVFGASCFVLAISGAEGPMPQTYEHLHILKLLGIESGIVAITKWDLVSATAHEQVHREVDELIAYAGYKDVPVVSVSAETGTGIDELRNEVGTLCRRSTKGGDEDRPTRFFVDRVLTVRSVGAVATGTLKSGALCRGDAVIALPARTQGKVGSIQVLDKGVKSVGAVERIAIGLGGISADEIGHGDVLVLESENHPPTFTIEADIELLKTAQIVRRRTGLTVHLGSSSTPAKVTPLPDRNRAVDPGTESHVRIRLERPLVMVEGDRFLLRSAAGAETVGGGVVTEAASRKWIRIDEEELGRGATSKKEKRKGGPRVLSGHDMVVEHLNEAHQAQRLLEMDGYSPRTAAMLAEVINLTQTKTKRLLRELAGQGSLTELDDSIFINSRVLEDAREKVLDACDEKGGIKPFGIQSLLGVSVKYARLFIENFEGRKDIEKSGKVYVRCQG